MAELNSKTTHNQRGNCELLPCPFCGGEAEIIINKTRQGQTSNIRCSVCSCRKTMLKHPLYDGDIEQDAIDNWNTRTQQKEGESNVG